MIDHYFGFGDDIDNDIRNAILEIETTRILISLGIRTSSKGFAYLRTAIILTYYSPDITEYVTKTLYPKLRRICGASSIMGVERTCRHTVSGLYNGKFAPLLSQYFEFDPGITLSCSQFISGIAGYLHNVI